MGKSEMSEESSYSANSILALNQIKPIINRLVDGQVSNDQICKIRTILDQPQRNKQTKSALDPAEI